MLALSLLIPLALAEEPTAPSPAVDQPTETTTSGAEATATSVAEPKTKSRDFLMEVGFRGRFMSLPEGILDLGAEPHNDDEFPSRPDVSGYTIGLEFIVKEKSANGIFYVEFFKPLIDDGYWDDMDRNPDYTDGSWIKFDDFSFVVIGADYAYELHANNWLSFLFGAGIGAGIKMGNIYEWQAPEDPENPDGNNNNNTDPDCTPEEQALLAYERYDKCSYDAELYPDIPVLPFLDINLGVRFSISNRASIRLEGGIHNLFYGGAAVGVVF